eukprot:jgi/Mesen1/10550/ME000083S10055
MLGKEPQDFQDMVICPIIEKTCFVLNVVLHQYIHCLATLYHSVLDCVSVCVSLCIQPPSEEDMSRLTVIVTYRHTYCYVNSNIPTSKKHVMSANDLAVSPTHDCIALAGATLVIDLRQFMRASAKSSLKSPLPSLMLNSLSNEAHATAVDAAAATPIPTPAPAPAPHVNPDFDPPPGLPPALDEAIFFCSAVGSHGFLSNFHCSPFHVDGTRWPSSEHWYQAQKFLEEGIRERVRSAGTPMKAAMLGRRRDLPLRRDWEEVKEDAMRRAVLAKFEQNGEVRRALLATGDARLVEHTARDAYWGDGGDGSGRNRLGGKR